MNDIRPPKRVQRPAVSGVPLTPGTVSAPPPGIKVSAAPKATGGFGASGFSGNGNETKPPAPLAVPKTQETTSPEPPKKRSKVKTFLWVLASLLIFLMLALAALWGWYRLSLEPVSPGNEARTRVEIVSGSSPSQIGQLLEEKKLIRSRYAFDIYTRLTGTRNKLQAGTYSLSPSESTKGIVDHLVAGKVDQFSLTFLPGATLAQNRAQLLAVGYSETEVDTALKKQYDHPLFADKPASADLEGYIYGETYKFQSSATVEEVLRDTFDLYYKVLAENNLIEGFKAHGLNLYEGITLASIIQREVPTPADQKQVAQVFFTRLSIGMELGADATFMYAAKKLGVPPTPSLDSPYNTRKYTGLPPGPIATPGLTALKAVAAPADGDYIYFVSGDDGTTHFARTLTEHEANTRNYCQKNCLLPQ